jgi:hypothetical protein
VRKFHRLALLLSFLPLSHLSQIRCGIGEPAFRSLEELHYKVVYNWGPVWLESGHASFSVNSMLYNGRQCYHLRGMGSTYPKYDWFYKVNDLFESYVDSATFRPVKFMARINEGGKHDQHTYLFSFPKKKAYTIISRGKKQAVVDTVPVHDCTIDVLSAIYYARSLDFSASMPNDTIGMSLLIDGTVFPIYVRYIGKDSIRLAELGSFRCVKFKPLLVEGSIFKKGEDMTVWVSDDANHLPLYIETPIVVGMVKVRLVKYKGLKFPLNSEKPRD